LEPIADELLEVHLNQLQAQWLDELRAMDPIMTQYFQLQSIEYVFRMRRQANTLRVWFARKDQVTAGIAPLAEESVPKDRWISPDAEVVTYPPILNEGAEDRAALLFSGLTQGVRAPNPEISGGYVALVVTNNNKVPKPSNSLERIHACSKKQVALNQRILKNEEEVSGINAGLADFLQV
jgi:hypothetical protein